jgi:hypothetical protein
MPFRLSGLMSDDSHNAARIIQHLLMRDCNALRSPIDSRLGPESGYYGGEPRRLALRSPDGRCARKRCRANCLFRVLCSFPRTVSENYLTKVPLFRSARLKSARFRYRPAAAGVNDRSFGICSDRYRARCIFDDGHGVGLTDVRIEVRLASGSGKANSRRSIIMFFEFLPLSKVKPGPYDSYLPARLCRPRTAPADHRAIRR